MLLDMPRIIGVSALETSIPVLAEVQARTVVEVCAVETGEVPRAEPPDCSGEQLASSVVFDAAETNAHLCIYDGRWD